MINNFFNSITMQNNFDSITVEHNIYVNLFLENLSISNYNINNYLTFNNCDIISEIFGDDITEGISILRDVNGSKL